MIDKFREWFGWMNRIDRQWYKALRFLSKLSLDETFDFKKKNPKKFIRYVPDEVENTLEKFGHITYMIDAAHVVSPSGLQQLRYLEDIRRKDLTLIASVIAVIISLVALAKSMGWI